MAKESTKSISWIVVLSSAILFSSLLLSQDPADNGKITVCVDERDFICIALESVKDARVYEAKGDYKNALNHYASAFVQYARLSRFDEAEPLLEKVEVLFKLAPSPQGEAVMALQRGMMEASLAHGMTQSERRLQPALRKRRLDSSIANLSKALDLFKAQGNRQQAAAAGLNLGHNLSLIGKDDDAMRLLTEWGQGEDEDIAYAEHAIADIRAKQGKVEDAQARYIKAYGLRVKNGRHDMAIQTLSSLVGLLVTARRFEDALKVCGAQVSGIEEVSQNIRHEDVRVTFRDHWRRAYDTCVNVSFATLETAGSNTELFNTAYMSGLEFSHRMRGLELLTNFRKHLASTKPAEELKREELKRREDVKTGKTGLEPNRIWQEERSKLRGRLKAKNSELIVSLQDIGKRIPEDTTVVQFHLTSWKSYAWILTRPKAASSAQIQLSISSLPSREEIALLVNDFVKYSGHATTVGSAERQEYLKLNRTLSKLLFERAPAVLSTRNLVIIPDETLSRVPFSALTLEFSEGNRDAVPMVNGKVVRMSPSLSVAFRDASPTYQLRGKPMLFVGDPVLSETDDRILRSIRSRLPITDAPGRAEYGRAVFQRLTGITCRSSGVCSGPSSTTAYFGFDATKDRLNESQLASAGLVAFLTHAKDEENANLSYLLFSNYKETGTRVDGRLTVSDIYSLDSGDNLIVLGSCVGARGPVTSSEGAMSLARAFLSTGARQVLAAGWAVDQLATEYLLERFLRNIREGSMPPAEALVMAQRTMRTDPKVARWKDPYYWAGFQIYGDGRF